MFWVQHVTVRETEAGLFYTNGQYERTVAAGRHPVLRWPWLKQEIVRVDLRRTELAIAGQEVLTADALSVRLNVTADYRIVNPVVALHDVQDYRAALYSALQLVLREAVQARTLDGLLANRAALSQEMLEPARAAAQDLGLELLKVGVKDIILPGDVKKMLAQELEAQRAGRAALVAAREEVAATRAKANTARLLEENPMLVRLREIEALAQVAGGLGNTVVIAVPSELTGLARVGLHHGDTETRR